MLRAALCLLIVAQCLADSGSSISSVGANPIRRIVTMLQRMATKVEAEGKTERALFEKHACYCKTNAASLGTSIAKSTASVPQVQSDIEATENQVKGLQQELASHHEDRAAAKAAIEAATAQRNAENAVFLKSSGEYNSFISSLASAIPAIANGMAGSFLQSSAGAHLREAVASAATLTDFDRDLVTAFLSGGSSDGDGYVPKSGEIVGILKTMKTDFEKSLAEVTAEENSAVQLFEDLVAAKKKQVATLGASIERKTSRVGQLEVDVVNMKSQLNDEQAALVQDQKFKSDLDAGCSQKDAEWDERQKIRSEELVAIQETIKVLNDDEALEVFKSTLPSPSLLQVDHRKQQIQQRALAVLRGSRAGRPGLDFVELALSGKSVDFTKVLKMVDDMLKLLNSEQAADDNKKVYCEKQIDTTEDKVKALNQNVQDLHRSAAQAEEAVAAFEAEIQELTAGIAALDRSVAEATADRKAEHAAYLELLSSDGTAKQLLQFAKNRLNKFYNKALYKPPPERVLTEEERIYTNFGGELDPTAAPRGIAGTGISLAQVSLHQQRREEPEAPPATWDAYEKKTAETTGVINLIDMLIRELDKEVTEAETDEKNAQSEYVDVMDDSAKKRAADSNSVRAKSKAKADAEESKVANAEAARVEAKELEATQRYEMQLHQECDWLAQNHGLRKSARADESEALKQAKAILSGADFSLLQGNAEGSMAQRHLRGK